MQIKRGFQNNFNLYFSNIVNVNFSSTHELNENLDELLVETKKEINGFVTNKYDYDGIFLYSLKNKEDDNYAYRIYRDFEKYKYRRHYDDYLISKLQAKQKIFNNIDFPIGVVSVENYVIGQIIYFYKNSQTVYSYLQKSQNNFNFENEYFNLLFRALTILIRLYENDIYYIDMHPNNFLLLDNGEIKIIDFENRSFDYTSNKENRMKYNLYYIINLISDNFNIETDIKINDSVEDIYKKIKKKVL